MKRILLGVGIFPIVTSLIGVFLACSNNQPPQLADPNLQDFYASHDTDIESELAWPITPMGTIFMNEWPPNQDAWDAYLNEHFVPGPFEEGGQDLLRESLTSFYQARVEANKKAKAELIYLGNFLVALHEQNHLQPIIEKAVAVPFDVFAEGLMPSTDQDTLSPGRRFKFPGVGFLRNLILRTVTRMWTSYSLPTREMKLGKDVVAPTGLVNFPSDLLTIESPRCVRSSSSTPPARTLSLGAAANWARLEDRMSFIVDFFRGYARY